VDDELISCDTAFSFNVRSLAIPLSPGDRAPCVASVSARLFKGALGVNAQAVLQKNN
jgi:hypothetical protein